MTEKRTRAPMHVKTWTLKLDLFEDGDTTTAHGVLDTGDNVLESRSSAHRSPQDAAVPEIGDEYAAGRALMELGHRLLVAGMHDAAANTPATSG
ncbi:dsRBD fold-containing protein [Streptomyces sp. NRRL B-24484]|uniref:dsRBD fold-containing protein n=1 Tax=Streptomyces sp. NRRL B-24484 TaxID=1463833 RepID=UPI0005B8558F|nr:dsRBD fold-containing protein [Streptomyces sp. NRRL B-24484]